MLKFAIQLYSVRDLLAKDEAGTLAGVKRAGFDNVELFGVTPPDAARWKTLLADAGLHVAAAHVDYDIVVSDSDAVVEMARTLGFKDIIVPWLELHGRAAWAHAAATMNEIGARVRAEGFRLGYHNHYHEFQSIDETNAFDIIFDYAEPENLFLELDVRWSTELGGDAIEIIRKFGARCRFLHLKERPRSGEGFTELGRGAIDWPTVIAEGHKAGVQWYIAEQDESTDPLASAAVNAAYLKQF